MFYIVDRIGSKILASGGRDTREEAEELLQKLVSNMEHFGYRTVVDRTGSTLILQGGGYRIGSDNTIYTLPYTVIHVLDIVQIDYFILVEMYGGSDGYFKIGVTTTPDTPIELGMKFRILPTHHYLPTLTLMKLRYPNYGVRLTIK